MTLTFVSLGIAPLSCTQVATSELQESIIPSEYIQKSVFLLFNSMPWFLCLNWWKIYFGNCSTMIVDSSVPIIYIEAHYERSLAKS